MKSLNKQLTQNLENVKKGDRNFDREPFENLIENLKKEKELSEEYAQSAETAKD